MIASSEVFLDTNVLLYAALGRDHAGHRWERAREIVLAEDYCTSGQVLAEFYNNATRKGASPLTPDRAREWVRVVAMKPCQPITPAPQCLRTWPSGWASAPLEYLLRFRH